MSRTYRGNQRRDRPHPWAVPRWYKRLLWRHWRAQERDKLRHEQYELLADKVPHEAIYYW